ncbi:MAG: nucleotidyltransferase domain-containing protein [Candidatus Thermoplasmatota archaeon]
MRESFRRGKRDNRQKLLEKELKRIINKLRSDSAIQKIILFGSLAKGEVSRSSDIDLIVVKHTNKRFFDRLDELNIKVQPNVGLDIFVYSPDEFVWMRENNVFVRHALRTGVILHEAKPSS